MSPPPKPDENATNPSPTVAVALGPGVVPGTRVPKSDAAPAGRGDWRSSAGAEFDDEIAGSVAGWIASALHPPSTRHISIRVAARADLSNKEPVECASTRFPMADPHS